MAAEGDDEDDDNAPMIKAVKTIAGRMRCGGGGNGECLSWAVQWGFA